MQSRPTHVALVHRTPPPRLALPMASADRAALEALFHSTGGGNWISRYKWATDADLSTWDGVKVDGDGRVVELTPTGSLLGNNLQGISGVTFRTHIARLRYSRSPFSKILPVKSKVIPSKVWKLAFWQRSRVLHAVYPRMPLPCKVVAIPARTILCIRRGAWMPYSIFRLQPASSASDSYMVDLQRRIRCRAASDIVGICSALVRSRP